MRPYRDWGEMGFIDADCVSLLCDPRSADAAAVAEPLRRIWICIFEYLY